MIVRTFINFKWGKMFFYFSIIFLKMHTISDYYLYLAVFEDARMHSANFMVVDCFWLCVNKFKYVHWLFLLLTIPYYTFVCVHFGKTAPSIDAFWWYHVVRVFVEFFSWMQAQFSLFSTENLTIEYWYIEEKWIG